MGKSKIQSREYSRIRSREARSYRRRRSRMSKKINYATPSRDSSCPTQSVPCFKVSEHSDLYVEMHSSIKSTLTRVKKYIKALLKKGVRNPAAVFDIDETILQYVEKSTDGEKTEYARTIRGMRDFIMFLRNNGVAIRFITARRESGRDSTIKDLKKLQLMEDKDTLMMKPDHYPSKSSSIVKHFQRGHVAENMGHTIIVNVGDQMSDMLPESDWVWFASAVLKLPDCTLKRTMEKHAKFNKCASKILKNTMSEFNDHLVFLWLESDVAVSWKLPNTKWYTV